MLNLCQKFKLMLLILARESHFKSCNRVLSWFVMSDDRQEFKSQYVYNKRNTTWKLLCTAFTLSLFLYQKYHSLGAALTLDFWYVSNSCLNSVRPHFSWSIQYILHFLLQYNINTILPNYEPQVPQAHEQESFLHNRNIIRVWRFQRLLFRG